MTAIFKILVLCAIVAFAFAGLNGQTAGAVVSLILGVASGVLSMRG